jgi:glycosyltransferase involved in cell wall biosynthesis
MKILFVGSLVYDSNIFDSNAVSPAANQWQLDLIEGLLKNGIEVSVLSYFPEQIWPLGPLFVKNKSVVWSNSSFTYVDYLNIPFLRFSVLQYKFVNALNKICLNEKSKPDFVITYNATKANCGLGEVFQKKFKGKWISIIADGYSKGNPDSQIFLSFGYFQKSKIASKIHLDGAPPIFQGDKVSLGGRKIIIYSGSLDVWTGIEFFVQQFSYLNVQDFELHIYGKGKSRIISKIANENQNILLKGFVSSDELVLACKEAFAFVNPRPTHLTGVENNFPSKLLLYISFGKPILSTKTKGISGLYDEILNYYNPQDINSLRNQMKQLSSLSHDDLLKIYERNKEFCELNTWEIQASRVVALCHSLN